MKGVPNSQVPSYHAVQRHNSSTKNSKHILPGKKLAAIQSQFLHSCFCEWFIYCSDRSACSAAGNVGGPNVGINRSLTDIWKRILGLRLSNSFFWEYINPNFFAVCSPYSSCTASWSSCSLQLYCTTHTVCRGEGALSSSIVLHSCHPASLNNNRKSQFHIKELFLRGISSTAELIPPKESVSRNRVPTTMHVSSYSLSLKC
jgi:hypothetical protein